MNCFPMRKPRRALGGLTQVLRAKAPRNAVRGIARLTTAQVRSTPAGVARLHAKHARRAASPAAAAPTGVD